MPAAGYKGDQLKKNPLLGTTLNLKRRTEDKDRLLKLHRTARANVSKGREGMKRHLGKRATRYVEEGGESLADLRRRYASTQTREDKVLSKDYEYDFRDRFPRTYQGEHLPIVTLREAYERHKKDKIGGLRREGALLSEEYDRKVQSLQQHINDYNLFLGTY